MRPAWELLQRGELSDDPKIRETQERLQACSYAMAHPETGTLVPACAQHSVLDPLENVRLQELLPARERRRRSEVRPGQGPTAAPPQAPRALARSGRGVAPHGA